MVPDGGSSAARTCNPDLNFDGNTDAHGDALILARAARNDWPGGARRHARCQSPSAIMDRSRTGCSSLRPASPCRRRDQSVRCSGPLERRLNRSQLLAQISGRHADVLLPSANTTCGTGRHRGVWRGLTTRWGIGTGLVGAVGALLRNIQSS